MRCFFNVVEMDSSKCGFYSWSELMCGFLVGVLIYGGTLVVGLVFFRYSLDVWRGLCARSVLCFVTILLAAV